MSDAIREHILKLLGWGDAHVTFDKAIDGIPQDKRGIVPDGLPYSAWQLLEHMRLAQWDIPDFCRNAHYEELKWPDDYWPKSPEPPSAGAWDESVAAYRKDLRDLEAMVKDESLDWTKTIPHGSGQTYLREVLLIADHTAYHVGELIAVRRLLGIWK